MVLVINNVMPSIALDKLELMENFALEKGEILIRDVAERFRESEPISLFWN